MWWLLVSAMVSLYVVVAVRFGPQRGLGLVIPVAIATPAWCLLPLFEGPKGSIVGSGIDVKVAVGSVALLLYSFVPGRTFPLRLVLGDFAVMGLIAIHITSDVYNSGFSWMVLGRAYVEWYMPYLVGRLTFQRVVDLEVLARVMATVAMILGAASIVEGVFGFNLFESIVGWRPVEGTSRQAARWGFKRAFGPAMHPIYFGGQLLFVISGSAYLAWFPIKRRFRAMWFLAALLPALGIFFTGSRGPILGLLALALCFTFYQWQKLRVAIMLTGILCLGLCVAFREPVLGLLEKWSGDYYQREIVIDQEKHSYSTTRTRLLVFEVYRIALRRSGWLGFGTQAVSGFPVNVPLGPRDAETMRKVPFIDNAYILMTLRFGWLGALMFVGNCTVALGQLWYINQHSPSSRCRTWAVALAASLVAMLCLILTVWLPHELGFPLVWMWGASSGLFLLNRQIATINPPASKG